MLDLLIIGGTVVTMDPERRVLIGGAVGINGDRIVELFPDAGRAPEAMQTINATGKIVMPGLVDTHGHAGHTLTRGLGEGLDGDGWSELVGRFYFHASDERFWQAESALAALERLTFGVTTSLSMPGSFPRVDDPRYALAAATGYRQAGLRHIIAAGPPNGPWPWHYTDRTGSRPEAVTLDLDGALRVTEEIIATVQAEGNALLRAFVGPSAISPEQDPVTGEATGISRKQIAGVRRIVETYNTGLHAHAYKGMVRAAHAADPELLGPHVCLAHCAGIEPDEIEIMAATGTAASHGPLTHAYAEARFPVIEALDAGVNVVISTDGASPDRSFDLLSQGRVAAQLQRCFFADTSLLPSGNVLAMMTINAARALNMAEHIGSLEVGKQADIAIVDARQPHLIPQILPVSRLVNHAAGQDVETVIVAGKVLMRDREVQTLARDHVIAEATAAFWDTAERAGIGEPNQLDPGIWHGVWHRMTAP